VKHDDTAHSSAEQKRRRQWNNQDVGHLLSVLENADLSSSCSASCSESQTSCATDDAASVDPDAADQEAPDQKLALTENNDGPPPPTHAQGLTDLSRASSSLLGPRKQLYKNRITTTAT